MASPSDSNEAQSSQKFIEEIRSYVHQGFSFTPFVGCGMSAPSGILMGQDFSNFLAWTMYLVLRDPNTDTSNSSVVEHAQRWKMRTNGWPQFPNKSQSECVKKWVSERFYEICKRHGQNATIDKDHDITDIALFKGYSLHDIGPVQLLASLSCPLVPQILLSNKYSEKEINRDVLGAFRSEEQLGEIPARKGYSPTSEDYIVEKGIRALHDWRATLEFLAEVDIHDDRLMLRKRDTAVIDGFNVHITRDKQHNLGHKMLAHLCRPMRIRVILTTNFDNLIEEAFRRICRPLAVLPVSTEGRLPSPHTVHAQDCIVKMHGEFQETRADFSLNKEPDKEDKERFAEYFNPRSNFKLPHPIGSHLIMMGYSGADLRCIQLIKYLLDTHPETKVFWICFSKSDVEKVQEIFFESDYKEKDRLILHQTKRPDLLLYELYQELTLSLPEGGFAYEFTHKVPPERNANDCGKDRIAALQSTLNSPKDLLTESQQLCKEDSGLEETAKRHARKAIAIELGKSIVNFVREEDNGNLPRGLQEYAYLTLGETNGPLEKVYLLDLASGAADALALAFNELGNKYFFECVWLELQDYENPVALAQEMLRVLALRIGQYQQEHVVLFPEGNIPKTGDADFGDWKVRTLDHLRLLMEYFNILPNRWAFFLYGRDAAGGCAGWDNETWLSKDEKKYDDLDTLLSLFSEVGFRVVYAPLTKERFDRDQEKAGFIESKLYKIPEKILKILEKKGGFVLDEIRKEWSEEENLRNFVDSDFPLQNKNDSIRVCPSLQKSSISSLKRKELSIYENRLENVLEKWLTPFTKEEKEEGKDIGLEKWQVLRLRFLYAVTLFRHSRHTSAFYSEAVYPCPNRFNRDRIDNDWVRASRVRKWIARLRELHVFYHKPGGYAWKYRDVRLGLQALLQKLPLSQSSLKNTESMPNYLLEIRARTHFWIGDWYRKAFATTGHSVPVMEALYHRYQCAKFAKFARPHGTYDPREIQEYRLVLFRSAVLEMIKTLRLSRHWMKFWLSGKSIPPMLLDSGNLRDSFDIWRTEIYTKGPIKIPLAGECYLEKLINTLKWDLDCLAVSLKSENYTALPEETAAIEVPLHGFIIKNESPFLSSTVGSDDFRGTAFGDSNPILKVESNNLQKVLDQFWYEESEPKELEKKLRALEQKWLNDNTENYKEIYKQVDSMSELAYLYAKRAKMERHADERPEWQPFRWVQVTAICYHAIGLCKHLPPEIQEDAIRLYCKLHTIYGLALAYLGRFFEAQRHINEATALLSKSRAGLAPTELAIIRLRKAEIYLVEGEVLKNDFIRFENTFVKFKKENRSELSKYFINDIKNGKNYHPLVAQAIKKLRRDIGNIPETNLPLKQKRCMQFVQQIGRMHVAALDSAWSALESAEKLLAGQSHSALWWGRFLALKLRVYGARIDGKQECDPQVKGSRFEYLAFRRRIDHKAEVVRLFERGLLVSPNDSYRQLRIIDYFRKAYSSVKKALEDNSTIPKDTLAVPDPAICEKIEAVLKSVKRTVELEEKQHLLQRYYKIVHPDAPNRKE